MTMRMFAATAALVVCSAGVSGGAAHAAPAPKTGVNYTARIAGETAVITTDAGSLVNDNGVFKIKAANGQVVAGIPLQVRIDDFQFPIDARIDGRTATLTPRLDRQRAVYRPVALPFEDSAPWKSPYEREVAAWNRMFQTIVPAGVIGTGVGLLIGGVAGCVLGGFAGAVVTGILLELFGAGPLAGCLAGVALFAPIGGVAGALLITVPVAIAAAIQYFVTINEPFVPAPSTPQKTPAK